MITIEGGEFPYISFTMSPTSLIAIKTNSSNVFHFIYKMYTSS